MDIDDLEPQKSKAKQKDLDEMSIEAIEEYIQDLKSEIKRAEAATRSKQAARAGADAFFK
ncbi:MAG: DUF1192 domain-containing protein [Rhodospirillaceae bacterium]|nr:MAG: DUF1192 domain-containing protein [Rhodospirillaceae bacterium]